MFLYTNIALCMGASSVVQEAAVRNRIEIRLIPIIKERINMRFGGVSVFSFDVSEEVRAENPALTNQMLLTRLCLRIMFFGESIVEREFALLH